MSELELGNVKDNVKDNTKDNVNDYYKAVYYRTIDHSLMLYYYKSAIKIGCIKAMYELGCYYKFIKKYNLMIKYYIMAINNNCMKSLKKLIKYSKLKIFSCINKIDNINMKQILIFSIQKQYLPIIIYININNNQNLLHIFNNILNNHDVIVYKNKINAFGKIQECLICYNTLMSIPLECSHFLCIECYIKIML